MARYWILIFPWLGVASPQFINTAGPGAQMLIDPLSIANIDSPPLHYLNYLNFPLIRNDYESSTNEDQQNTKPFYTQDNEQLEEQRKRKSEDVANDVQEQNWAQAKGKTIQYEVRGSPYVIGVAAAANDNSTEIMNALEKKSFSPWGGKRSDFENMWSWKRSSNLREPSMPKRVRFSPWGGKRSGQMIYKPDNKKPKTIFSAYVPELTRIISNYPPGNKLNIAGVYFTPNEEKRNSIKVLPLDSLTKERTNNEIPFKSFLDSLPKLFRPGQTYANVFLKKDGKRKFKFSAWGGKRSPPIIGPIWAPTSQSMKDKALDSLVLIRSELKGMPKTT